MANVTHEQLAQVLLGIAITQATIIKAIQAPGVKLDAIEQSIFPTINSRLKGADAKGEYSLVDLPSHILRNVRNGTKPEFAAWLTQTVEKAIGKGGA